MKKILLLFLLIFCFPLVSALWSDGFDDGDISDWTLGVSAGSIAASTDTYTNGTHSMKLFDNDNTKNVNASIYLPENATNFNYSANVYFSAGGTQRLDIRLLNSSNGDSFTVMMFNAGKIRFANGSDYPNTFEATTYSASQWYNIQLYVEGDVYRCYLNGTEYCEANNVPFINNSLLDQVFLSTGTPSTGMTAYVDQISVITKAPDRNLIITAVNNQTAATINEFNVSVYYSNGTLFNQSNTSVGSITFNMTGQIFDNYTMYWMADNYQDLNATVEYLNASINFEFGALPAPTINITFLDEISRTNIDNVTYSLIFDDFAVNNTLINESNVYIKLNNTGLLEIEYNHPDYYLRKYFVNITPETRGIANLYLLNESPTLHQLVQYNTIDQDGGVVAGGIVKALRRYVINDNILFEVVEMSESDFNGEGGLHLQLNEGTYKFFVELDGVVVLQTGETQIFSNEINLISDLASSVIDSTVGTTELNVTFLWDEPTLTLTTNYNDPTGLTTQLCVDVKKVGQQLVTVNSSCNTGASGSLVIVLTNNSGHYQVYATQITNTEFSDKTAGVFSITLSDIKEVVGVSGIFYLLMFTIAGALIGLAVFQTAQHTIALTAIAFVIGLLFKITEFGWVAGITTVVIAGFLIYVVKQKGVFA